jgi:hypothetical protein
MSVRSPRAVEAHHPQDKPLHRTQQYIVELTNVISLLTKLLLEVKELIFVVGLIAVFSVGLYYLITHLHG